MVLLGGIGDDAAVFLVDFQRGVEVECLHPFQRLHERLGIEGHQAMNLDRVWVAGLLRLVLAEPLQQVLDLGQLEVVAPQQERVVFRVGVDAELVGVLVTAATRGGTSTTEVIIGRVGTATSRPILFLLSPTTHHEIDGADDRFGPEFR